MSLQFGIAEYFTGQLCCDNCKRPVVDAEHGGGCEMYCGDCVTEYCARIAALEDVNAMLRDAIDMTHACPVCPERTDNPVLKARIAELEAERDEARRWLCEEAAEGQALYPHEIADDHGWSYLYAARAALAKEE